jgi:predicted amidohydrolase
MKVAAIQFAPVFLDKMGNLRKLAKLVKQAAEAGAKLIVMPELCTTGYSFMSAEEAREQAEFIHPDVLTTRAMRILAETFQVHLVWGMVEKEGGTDFLFNSQVYVAPDGTWVRGAKINRWGADFLWAKAGRANPPIVEIDDDGKTRKVGLLVCRDVRDKKDDKKWTSFYEKGDADIVCLSANWGDGGFPSVSWMEFVEDNDAVLIIANRYGKEGPNDFGEGGSCIICPPDEVHCEGLTWNADCIVYAEV